MAAKRGRKSSADLAIVTGVSLGKRPEPPISLNNRATDEWKRVVNCMPANWFTDETLSILQAYCEHTSEGEAIQIMLEKVRKYAMGDDEAFARYRALLSEKERQTRAALSCATKMRLTQQSTYNAKSGFTAKDGAAGRSGEKPWEAF